MRPCFISGLYCSGWLKTGPTGVIATTMNNSFDTAKSLMDDMASGTVDLSASKAGFQRITGLLEKRGTHCFTASHGIQDLHVEPYALPEQHVKMASSRFSYGISRI